MDSKDISSMPSSSQNAMKPSIFMRPACTYSAVFQASLMVLLVSGFTLSVGVFSFLVDDACAGAGSGAAAAGSGSGAGSSVFFFLEDDDAAFPPLRFGGMVCARFWVLGAELELGM